MSKKIIAGLIVVVALLFGVLLLHGGGVGQTLRSLIRNEELYLGMQKIDAVKILDDKKLAYRSYGTYSFGSYDHNVFHPIILDFFDKKDPNRNSPSYLYFDTDGHLIGYELAGGIPSNIGREEEVFQKKHLPQCNTALEPKEEPQTCWSTDYYKFKFFVPGE